MMIDALGAKRVALDELERSEQEARRLDEALSRGYHQLNYLMMIRNQIDIAMNIKKTMTMMII